MRPFIHENFLLQSKTAEYLFHNHAQKMPVIDYHCHLDAMAIAENHHFENLTKAWLSGDHYKWRAMRANGIDEHFCTGMASDYEKFQQWSATVPYTLRNPLYHWTHLELSRYFGITDLLNMESAATIYEKATEMLHSPEYSVRNLLKMMHVKVLCTTDDPIDNLEHHHTIKNEDIGIRVLPAWRPDKVLQIDSPEIFNSYIDSLSEISDIEVSTFERLLEALKIRHDYFASVGCSLSDHGVDNFYTEDCTSADINHIFNKIRKGKELKLDEIGFYKSAIMYELAVMDFEKGWVQQFHVGPLRNNNTLMFNLTGPDTGFDSINDQPVAMSMSKFFNRLASSGKLPKTIIYNLNPAKNEVFAAMAGNFQDGITPGKIQWGPAWWFLDQKEGMEKQINTLSAFGLLSRFVGMTTDSRSFLSYPRHEYFRRILCNLLANDMKNGEIPDDKEWIGSMVEDICYNNANKYFGF